MQRRFFNIKLFILLFSIWWSSISWGDAYDLPKQVAVESRLFETKNEITPMVGYLPWDSFNKSVVFGGAYTHYFGSYWGWEVVNGMSAMNQNTGLKDDLINNFAVRPSGILDFIRAYATTNLVYTPIYSKNLLFNKSVVHSDLSFVGGGGVVMFDSKETYPMLGGGLISRYFINRRFSFKADARAYYHFGTLKSSNVILALNLGLSIQLSGSEKTEGP